MADINVTMDNADITVTLNTNEVIVATISATGIAMASTASNISTSTTNFNNNLSSADTTVQLALDTLDNINKTTSIGVSFTNNSKILSPNTSVSLSVPYDCTVTEWDCFSANTGTFVADIRKSTYAGYPSVSSIAGSDKPTLSSQYKNTSTTLTGWSKVLLNGDVLMFDIEQATMSGTVTVQLRMLK